MGGDRRGWRREFEYLARFMGTVEINLILTPPRRAGVPGKRGWSGPLPTPIGRGFPGRHACIVLSCIGVGAERQGERKPRNGQKMLVPWTVKFPE